MPRSTIAVLLGLLALGAAIGIAWGGRALAVYAFFAGIAAAVGIGTWIGGGWLRDASAGRFRRERD